MVENQNRLVEIQEQIQDYKQKLVLAEQNYQTTKKACRITDAKQLKIQIEYLHQQIMELEQQ
jgi:phage terminase large subunit-like protein